VNKPDIPVLAFDHRRGGGICFTERESCMDEVGMARAFLILICHSRSPIGPHSPQPGWFRVSRIRGEFSDGTDQAVLLMRKIGHSAGVFSE
jgi:hypothetical protein